MYHFLPSPANRGRSSAGKEQNSTIRDTQEIWLLPKPHESSVFMDPLLFS